MKELMTGNEAVGEAAIRAGCRFYFGYPITPQNEIPEYMSRRLPEVGGTFLQAESEIAAINMVIGAAASGKRVMTSSSGPGISLKQEGISYLVGDELPAVIVNMMRGGPGLGNIAPSQSDYFQATRGGGHGDYRTIVLAPASVQEAADLIYLAFDLADKYRNPLLLLGDGRLGQMMEPVEFREYKPMEGLPPKDYILDGCEGRSQRIIHSMYLAEGVLEKRNEILQKKFLEMEAREIRFEGLALEDAEILLVAYGTSARNCKDAVNHLRKEGIRVGLFRPITLWPYPYAALRRMADGANQILVVEMCGGQMVEDVRLAIEGKRPVHFFGRMGGGVPTSEQIQEKVKAL